MARPSWVQLSFRLDPPFQDLLSGQLAALGFRGFQQEDQALACFILRSSWSRKLEQQVQSLLQRFKKEFPACDVIFARKVLRDQNWNARWERSIGIVEATKSIIIKPSWRRLRKQDSGKTVLHIDPKMSFGTGHHETTRLSLVLLERYLHRGNSVLDIGSGTGVLSIAASKLGAQSVIGIDNDRWALLNARENVKRNRVGRNVKVQLKGIDALPRGVFDLIISNIDFPTIMKYLRMMKKKTKTPGIMILCGILVNDLAPLLRKAQSERLVPVEVVEENEWVAIALTRDATRRH